MAWKEVPLDTTPDCELHITVNVDEKNIPLILRFRYNTEGDFWHMDISNNAGEMLVSHAPLLSGVGLAANILRQFEYMGFGSAMIVQITENTNFDSPTISDLGSDFVLAWGSGDVEEGV